MEGFILYGMKDKDIYYIANTNPIIWDWNVAAAKKYYNRYTAECDAIRDYDNYRTIMSQIENKYLDNMYVASIDMSSNTENWRVKIL